MFIGIELQIAISDHINTLYTDCKMNNNEMLFAA